MILYGYMELEILLILVLIVLNGIFSAGEISTISVQKSKLKSMVKEKKDKAAEMVLNTRENPEKFLSSVQIGITLFGTLASSLSGIIAVERLKPFLKPYFGAFSESVSLAIAVIFMTYLFLVFGELVPKSIALSYRERVAKKTVPFILFTSKLFFFFVALLSLSTKAVLKLFHIKNTDDSISEGEIKLMIEESRRKGVIDKTEEEIFHGVFKFAKKSVKEIMVPKPRVYSVDLKSSPDEILNYIVENEFSRYPVYQDDKDNIVGVVYYKDIMREVQKTGTFHLEKIMKKPYFVPDTMEISKLFKEMQRRHIHMAIVVNEYGINVGIVSLEDIMEEIFGEIMDETDVEEDIERLKNGSYMVDGSTAIEDINEALKLDLPESPDYETLGGFILKSLGEIPKGGEVLLHGKFKLTVLGTDGRRILKVKIEPIE
ncbi:MAG: hemolysin family protein [Deltaproteobacteria bacterium]|nr:hemolysin family protein [Deltaproteobacteria bacterium]